MVKKVQEQDGFTLIEMMIVLMIISVLLLIAVPNMTLNTTVANEKGCQATIDLLQSQVGAFELDKDEKLQSLNQLLEGEYVQTITCPDKTELTLQNGIVKIK